MSRVAVVTGTSGGTGRATAAEFTRRGDHVALIARGQTGLDAAAAECQELGAKTLTVPVDVSDADAVADAVDGIETELGPIDVWVNVAFTSVFAGFDDIKSEEYRRATEVSYLGYVYATMAVLPRMKERNHGTIVHVGSALAYRGIPLQTAYRGAKHAIQVFHEALRCELLHEKSNVPVTMVQMPVVDTPQFSWVLSQLPKHPQPAPPIYQPEVAARAVRFAADHPKRREYWVGARTVGTLMANAVAPGVLDCYLGRTGFASQQSSKLRADGDLVNLWEPADGEQGRDFGAGGVFDDQAKAGSMQQWLSHRYPKVADVAVVTAVVCAAGRRR